ncbi:lipoprotein, partial [Mesoplasma seiffertii]|uniref:lipoprotein n=1 Tax=Mesoplasma seiffertii TaxID=28224 RepID=UPI000566EF88
MKKILALLGAIGLTVGAGATAVACGKRDKGKTVDISNFEKLVDIEVHGKYDTIEQAKEGIQNLKPLPEGIENIQVTIVKENNIKVILTAQKGYKTPKPLIKEFKAKSGETNKQLSEVITKIALGEFATIPSNETLIAKIKELNTTAKDLDLAVDGDVKPEGTIIKTTSSGYIGTVTITFTVKPVDQEVSTDEVQALLDTAVNEKEFADENAAINAAEGIKLPKGLQLDGEPTNSNQIITLKVKAKDGYKIADGQVTSFSATWVQTPIMVEDTTSIGASLTELVNGKEFADETAAITAAKKTQLADGVELDGEPTNSNQIITLKVKAKDG